MKRALLAIPVILITLLAVLLVAPGFMDWNQYKDQAQTQIKKITGHDVALNGDLSLAIIPAPAFYAEDVVVKAPQGFKKDIAKLERLDISVALMPLLSGEVVVNALTLVEPHVTLETGAQGRPNWKTAEIEALMNKEKPAPKAGEGQVAQAISLEDISIQDGSFLNINNGKTTEINGINLNVKADTLQGPFNVNGSLNFAGEPVEFDGWAGAIEPGAQSLSLKGNAKMKKNGADITYAGVVGLVAPFELQGETEIKVASLPDAAKSYGFNSANLKGILTTSAEKISLKNATLVSGGQSFTGDVNAGLKPLSVTGKFKGSDIVDLDKLLPASKGAGFDPNKPGAALPQTLSLPKMANMAVSFDLPGVIYKKQVYSGVTLGLTKKDKTFNIQFAANDIPGKGKIDLDADLFYAAKSLSEKTGQEVYSEPALGITLKGQSQNAAQLLQALGGQEIPVKSAAFDVNAALTTSTLQVKNSAVTLDKKQYTLAGTLQNSTVDADVGVAGGSLNVKGKLDGTSLKDMAVAFKHQNLAEALQSFSGASSPNKMLAQPIDFAAKIDQSGKVYKLADMRTKLGKSEITGDVTYDASGTKPALKGVLRAGDLVFIGAGGPAAANATAGGGSGGSGGTATGARWSNERIDTAWLDAMNADIDIAAKSIKYNTWDLSSPSLKFTLQNGALEVSELKSGLYGGSFSGSGSAKAADGGPLSITAKTDMSKIPVEQLVKSFVGNKIIQGTGMVNLKADISTTGTTQATMISGLKGSGTTTGSDLVLEGFDLTRFAEAMSEETKAGDSLLGLWKGSTKGGSTAFDTMGGTFTINQGVVNITKLDLDGPEAFLATKGNVALPPWTIQTAHTITLKERTDVPPFTINISGSLSNPGQTFAQGAIQDYLSRKATRKLEKLLGEKLGLPTAQQQPAQPAPEQVAPSGGAEPAQQPAQQQPAQQEELKPEDVINDVLKGFLQ